MPLHDKIEILLLNINTKYYVKILNSLPPFPVPLPSVFSISN